MQVTRESLEHPAHTKSLSVGRREYSKPHWTLRSVWLTGGDGTVKMAEGTVPLSNIKIHPALLGSNASGESKSTKENPYLQHLTGVKKKRPSTTKPLALNTPGKFVKLREKEKEEDELLALMREVETEIDTNPVAHTPSIVCDDWWDKPFLNEDGSLKSFPFDDILYDPEPVGLPLALSESITAKPKPLFLTKAEQKKIRRERRLAEQRDRQEQIRLGLLPPEQPKQRLSSLITMGTKQLNEVGDAVAEPTARESAIREAMAARQAQHEAMNQERALDAIGRREKLIKKYREDLTEGQVYCLLVKIESHVGGKELFKLTANARQNHLLGLLAVCEGSTAIFVEGGQAAIKRYRHLVLNRMPELGAHIVHEGVKRRPDFNSFITGLESEFDVRSLMEKHDCSQYWSAFKSFKPPE